MSTVAATEPPLHFILPIWNTTEAFVLLCINMPPTNPICVEAAALNLRTSVDLNWTQCKSIFYVPLLGESHPSAPYCNYALMLQLSDILIVLNATCNLIADPLEQFDVLALPIIGGGLTNLSLLLALNILIMSV